MKANAFWQDRRDTVFGGKGKVINVTYEAIGGGHSNVRLTREQASDLRDALEEALLEKE